jgi:hypothetical protein
MNAEQSSKEPALTGEAVAAAYLAQELPKARKNLKRTRIICIILILFVGAYMGAISTVLANFFEPKAAAEVASGMLAQHVSREGPLLALHIERQIPLLIREAPDYLIKVIPDFRLQLQKSLETESDTYCISLNKDLGARVDKFIDEHKTEIGTLLRNGSDRDVIRKTLPDFDKAITDCLTNDVGGQAAKEHIDAWAASLSEVEKHMDRLANGSDLTPAEQKTRHALAMLSKVIKDNTQLPETISAPAAPAATKK